MVHEKHKLTMVSSLDLFNLLHSLNIFAGMVKSTYHMLIVSRLWLRNYVQSQNNKCDIYKTPHINQWIEKVEITIIFMRIDSQSHKVYPKLTIYKRLEMFFFVRINNTASYSYNEVKSL